MSIALRQNTTADAFSSATLSGSLLLCVVSAFGSDSAGPSIGTPSTIGFSWTLAKSESYQRTVVDKDMLIYIDGAVAVYYIADASSMATSTTTSVSISDGTGSFRLYEFTGVGSSIDTSSQGSSVTGATVSAGNLTTTHTDLIFVASTDGSASAGSGYTLGVVDNDQYILNESPGTISTNYGSSTTYWAAVAVAFVPGSASASPSGVASDFTIHNPSTMAGSSSATSGVSASFTIGTALPGGAVAFAEPSGVSMLSALGVVTAGLPISYGNVVSGSSGLPSGVNTTYFYVRWTGWLTVSTPGVYTLGLNVEDGGDFYIGTQPIVNTLAASQSAHSTVAYTNSSTVELAANIAYPLVIEWQHGSGANYECQLLWTPPGGSVEVIPTGNLSLAGKWWNGTSSPWYPNTWY